MTGGVLVAEVERVRPAAEHDDMVDALAYALTELDSGPGLPFGWMAVPAPKQTPLSP